MYAQVAIARPFATPLTYAIPAHVEVRLGHVVLVPLGNLGETGYIVGTTDAPGIAPEKIKPLSRVLDPIPAFDAQQLDFFRWIADYYLASLGEVIATALPGQLRAKVVHVFEPTDGGALALADQSAEGATASVLREVISRPGLTRRGLVKRLKAEIGADDAERGIATAVRRGWIRPADREIAETRSQVKTLALAIPLAGALLAIPPRFTRQRALLAELASAPADLPDVLARHGEAARAAIRALVEAGVLAEGEREKRDPLDDAHVVPSAPPALNPDQREALAAIAASEGGTFLLHGVTGAGKTEVFLGAAQQVLARDRQVLVLVPEIGLTPQLVGRFKSRFGPAVAVLHSGLTGVERLAQWRRIRAGEATVAVGARSALFAPFRDLGLVVVDEEHDDSYKQDEGVRYNARDLAVVLGRQRRAVVVLATATPSLESWWNAKQGRYTLLRLPVRATPRPVPKVEVVDLSVIPKEKGVASPLLAPQVHLALQETFDRGGQAIVLYNRRGYATLVECGACGAAYECPSCGLAMTLHQVAARLQCHYCGYAVASSPICPVCRAPELAATGKGTERVEEQLAELFPNVRQARMDADTTAARGAIPHLLDRFRAGETQLLVGTQIVAKGHDFPGVHTAVVISADRGIRMPDFRAAERTYALLVQLAGRAGRGTVPGRVFVQSWKPDHPVFQYLDDVDAFLEAESRLRFQLKQPPHTRLCLVRLEAVDRTAAQRASSDLAKVLRAEMRAFPGVAVLGPAPAALPRLVGRWRFQLLIRGEQQGPYRQFLASCARRIAEGARGGVRVSWDVDPRHLM